MEICLLFQFKHSISCQMKLRVWLGVIANRWRWWPAIVSSPHRLIWFYQLPVPLTACQPPHFLEGAEIWYRLDAYRTASANTPIKDPRPISSKTAECVSVQIPTSKAPNETMSSETRHQWQENAHMLFTCNLLSPNRYSDGWIVWGWALWL